MSIVASQRNRAVSQSAVEAVVSSRQFKYERLFALPGNHNILDGTFHPFTPGMDCGWWGSELSNSDGYLPNPAVLTVTEKIFAYTYNLVGIEDNFPVDFTLTLYRNEAVQKVITVVDNTEPSVEIVFDRPYDIDKYVLSVTRISSGSDVLKVSTASFKLYASTLMKAPERRIHGRVEVTYANITKDSTVHINAGAYGSSTEDLTNTLVEPTAKFFKLYDNKLDGTYKVAGYTSETGWWPKTMPDENGVYASPKELTLRFTQRNLYGLTIVGDPTGFPKTFDVIILSADGTRSTTKVTDNTEATYRIDTLFKNAIGVDIIIYASSAPNRPAVILEVPVSSSIIYEDKDLVDISLLEELSYEDSLEKLGGISANELSVNFSNEDESFYFNNPTSPVAGYLKKNRRIRAWLGAESLDTGAVVWSMLGTFWTYDWNVPVGSLIAKTTAFDTIGLLGTQKYYNHAVYRDKSVGELIEIVLTEAKQRFEFLTWEIEPALYDIIVPIAWFMYDSYMAALNRIASCDLVNIYCARDGRIMATRRLSGVSTSDDVWSESTNIVETTYPTLHTDRTNYIDVHITKVSVSEEEVLKIDNAGYNVQAGEIRDFTFSGPVETLTSIQVDSAAEYTYEWYSWGLRVTFTTKGKFNSIVVRGQVIATDSSSSVHLQDDVAIEDDGIVSSEVRSDFIQTEAHAARLAKYLYDNIEISAYDAEVKYRGDISLTLNDKINLRDGLTPSNLYFIKRHELHWNGGLTGSARLNT